MKYYNKIPRCIRAVISMILTLAGMLGIAFFLDWLDPKTIAIGVGCILASIMYGIFYAGTPKTLKGDERK